MFGNPMLDVAIGLIFFYLLISIIVTVLQEFIASLLRLRNRNLLNAVKELVGNSRMKDFFNHELIYPLFRGDVKEGGPKDRGPAYIPRRNFALAILDIQNRQPELKKKTDGQWSLPREPAFELASFFIDNKASLGDLLKRVDAANTGDSAVKELENLFDSSMARASGWYKKQC